MTKERLRRALLENCFMNYLFGFDLGDCCIMFRANKFSIGDEIIYIPDTSLNEIPLYRSVREDEIENVIECCYTGNDFLELCGGDAELAERVFLGCTWQHPSTELDQLERMDEEEAE